MVTFDCHRPGSTIVSLDMTPDSRTACATSLPVAFLRLTSGPLLQAVSAPTQAITQTAYFILVSPKAARCAAPAPPPYAFAMTIQIRTNLAEPETEGFVPHKPARPEKAEGRKRI